MSGENGYRSAIPVNVSSANQTLPSVCSALFVGSGGTLTVDM